MYPWLLLSRFVNSNLAQRRNQGFELQTVTFEKKKDYTERLTVWSSRTWNLNYTVVVSDRNLQVELELVSSKQEIPVCYDSQPH